MNKKTIIILITIIILASLTWIFVINKSKETTPTNNLVNSPLPTTNLPKSSISFQKPEGFKIDVSGIEVNNIYNLEPKINERGDVTFVTNARYQILYFSLEKEFLISILDSPFEEIRQIAENELLNKLEIDKIEACKLKVNISTPSFANPDKSGKNYKLSFCQ